MKQEGTEISKSPEITLLKSEMEAAAARVAERAMNTTLDGVTGVLGDVFGGWFGDGLKQWRTRRLVTALVRTKEHLEAAGISIDNAKALPMGEIYAIFEGCSKQEDVSLTEMWSALLANAMNPESEAYIDPSFIKVLNNISGLDAVILNYIEEYEVRRSSELELRRSMMSEYKGDKGVNSNDMIEYRNRIEELDKKFFEEINKLYENNIGGFTGENISFSISNLLRMGLIYAKDHRIPDNLIQVGIRRGRDELITDDSRLRAYLKAMSDQAGAAIEKKSALQKLVTDTQFSWRIAEPVYSLSGFAKRFLAACSP